MSTLPPRVALVTAAEYRHLDEDLDPLAAALAARGVAVTIADWHDERVAWADVDLAVLRSPWDYTWQLDAFLAWADGVAVATVLANPLDVVRWNTDKRYLVQLAAAGVPVVPTDVLEPGDPVALAWPDEGAELVVKPVVSAGARDTERFAPEQAAAAEAHARSLLAAGRAVLVQPYLAGVDHHGETAVVYVGDAYSHGLRKGAILVPGVEFVEGLYREESMDGREPSAAEREVAESVLDAVAACLPGRSRADLLYARVDLVPGPDGAPVLLELEVTEPSLFHGYAPGSADRFAAAIAARLT